jgi:hypothetical protein
MEMKIISILILLFIGIAGLFNKKNNILRTIIIFLMVVGSLISIFEIIKDKTNFNLEKNKCNNALSEACENIYNTVNNFNRDIISVGNEKATFVSGIGFKANGNELEFIYNKYNKIIDSDSIKFKAVFKSIKLLKGVPEYIIQDDFRLRYLYSYICSIDASYLNKKPLYELIKR